MFGVGAVALGLASVIGSELNGDPGAMDTAFGLFYGSLEIAVGLAGLWWSAARLRRHPPADRRRGLLWIGFASLALGVLGWAILYR